MAKDFIERLMELLKNDIMARMVAVVLIMSMIISATWMDVQHIQVGWFATFLYLCSTIWLLSKIY